MALLRSFLSSLLFLAIITTSFSQSQRTGEPSKTAANKELVKKIFEEIVNKKNLAFLDQHFAADVVDHSAWPDQAPGREGLKVAVKGMFDKFPDVNAQIQEILAEGDMVATREKWSATDKSSGKKKSGEVIHIFKFRNGMIVDEWSQGWEWMN